MERRKGGKRSTSRGVIPMQFGACKLVSAFGRCLKHSSVAFCRVPTYSMRRKVKVLGSWLKQVTSVSRGVPMDTSSDFREFGRDLKNERSSVAGAGTKAKQSSLPPWYLNVFKFCKFCIFANHSLQIIFEKSLDNSNLLSDRGR